MRRAEQRRRLILVGGSVLVVIAIIVAIVVIRNTSKPSSQAGRAALPPAVASSITNVPASTLSQIGTGPLAPLSGLPMRSISDPTLTTTGGKPEFLYIGAEFCPYCAAMRWSMAVALSHFGTFGPLKGIHSSSTDVDPDTATLTFYKQKYSSPYLNFTPVENETVTGGPLQPTTKDQQAVWTKYDTTSQGGTGFPFMYFGGKVIITGPLYDPGVLKGLTWSQIAAQLKDPNSKVAQNINGAANYVTASICKITSNTPATVCKAGPIPALESKL